MQAITTLISTQLASKRVPEFTYSTAEAPVLFVICLSKWQVDTQSWVVGGVRNTPCFSIYEHPFLFVSILLYYH